MLAFVLLALLCAGGETFAVYKNRRALECVFKPAVMLAMVGYLHSVLPGDVSFHAAALLSCLGDVLLIFDERFFLGGLVSFLLAHVFYLCGLAGQFARLNSAALPLALVVAVLLALVLRPVVGTLAARDEKQRALIVPVMLYGSVIAAMTFSALTPLFDDRWLPGHAVLVGAGAALFMFSDVVLAWNKWVMNIKGGRVVNIVSYFAGQIMLVAGLAHHFASV